MKPKFMQLRKENSKKKILRLDYFQKRSQRQDGFLIKLLKALINCLYYVRLFT